MDNYSIEKLLQQNHISTESIFELLSPDADNYLEMIAQKASKLTMQYHGKVIHLFSPLYISDYCDNECVYCAFRKGNKSTRSKLNTDEMIENYRIIKSESIDSILLLTGESKKMSPPEYIANAIRNASTFFSSIGIEIYPLDTDDYELLHKAGSDSLTLYQETYDKERYAKVHIKGRKSDFQYRYDAPARAINAGFKQITIGALYGLSDPIVEAYNTALHLQSLMTQYPFIEYSVSFPRIKDNPIVSIDDVLYLKIILAFRLLFPEVGITMSTREAAHIRDGLTGLCITKLSAGSKTNVGGYGENTHSIDQFAISDHRETDEIIQMIRSKNCEPVMKNWVHTGDSCE
ncbi:MAG: thiamine biosynthesis protein ThiH [Spirochaetes bacterium GWF1_31_7]|nr:MAG: thiamine biosynthesis protein ThiH [Spirochaetes bacterium GWE1_32_154]OHD50038.1 MAG: thiamine biosynthesis protein ThiH [Spirochaetes bacterium GWE2_31_10]OHD52352.1 MAG: thiamine biosynthesis protein ThiH [Spirochaetes bacterium GWF1_31_7]OHD83164.1 MAG: thiamine biosynthesis protein ThiH [Spirochaetes bacterium RIFOXYB1_FULL_32_8]HBD95991.1 2-iminoacetate synthase ThiH [Spirochaetia bacterium]